jgi:hypothetical protein
MAKDQTAILQQVVAELRQLNKANKKDMIRDREALDRQERMAVAAEETGNTAGEVLSDGQDFQRRFIAGQAKTLIDKGRVGQAEDENKPATRGRQDSLYEALEEIYDLMKQKRGDDAENAREKDKDKDKKDKVPKSGGGSLAKAAKGAAGMAAIGLGLGGFMSGMMVWSGVEAFRGENFPEQAKNLKDGFNHIGGMDNKALVVMGSMVAAGGLFGATLGVGKSIKGAIGMSAVGLGLGGFMAGLMAPGELTDFDGATFPLLAKNLTTGFNHLAGMDAKAFTALSALMVVGAAGGQKPFVAGKAAVGMAAAGVGLGAFMTGIAASGDITKFKGDYFAAQAQNIADGLSAFSGAQLGGLAALMAVGGVLGALPGGVVVAGAAATGMGLIGVGIGAFVGGIAGIGDILSAMGVDGSGLKTMLDNISGGLNGFNDIDGTNFSSLGTGVAALGIGLAALFGVDGLTKVANFFSSGWNSIKGMFGLENDGRTGLEKLLDDVVKPFESIDFASWNAIEAKGFGDNLEHIARGLNAWSSAKPGFWGELGAGLASLFAPADKNKPFDEIVALGEKSTEIGKAATAMEKLAKAMKSMADLNFSGDQFKFSKFAHDLVQGTEGIHVAMYGGTYDPHGTGIHQRKIKIETGKGLAGIPPLDFQAAGNGITILQRALQGWDGNAMKGGSGSGQSVINSGGNVNQIINNIMPESIRFGKPGARAGFGATAY